MTPTEKQTMTKALVSAALGGAVIYFRAIAIPLVILFGAVLCDYLTGMAKAWYKSELSSDIGFKGIIKKLCYFVLVCVGSMCDWLITSGLTRIGVEIQMSYYVGVFVTIWLIINELISILENLADLDVPIPNIIKKLLKRIKKQIDDEGGNDNGNNSGN